MEEPEEVPKTDELMKFYMSYKGSNQFSVMGEKGICLRKIFKDGDETEKACWSWKEFSIESQIISKTSKKEYYKFSWDNEDYPPLSLKDMRNLMEIKCNLGGSIGKNIFGPMVNEYCNVNNIPIVEGVELCGWDNGWILPSEHYIIDGNSEILKGFYDNIGVMNNHIYDPTMPHQFRELYDSIGVRYRDVILAFGMIAPFMFSIMDETDFLMFLGLYSNKNQSGKTYMGQMITKKFWGHSENLNSTIMNSPSRARDYLCSSTLPILIDECEKLNDACVDTVKTMATSKSKGQYKNIDQTLGMNKYLCATPVYTMNTPSEIFHDMAYLTRGILLDLNIRDFDNRDEFKRCYSKIKDGAIGRFIIENTRDLTKKMLINQFHSINIDDPQIKGRSRTNMRLLVLGGWIFEKVFGWELDLSKLTTAILSSEKMEVTDYIRDEEEVEVSHE